MSNKGTTSPSSSQVASPIVGTAAGHRRENSSPSQQSVHSSGNSGGSRQQNPIPNINSGGDSDSPSLSRQSSTNSMRRAAVASSPANSVGTSASQSTNTNTTFPYTSRQESGTVGSFSRAPAASGGAGVSSSSGPAAAAVNPLARYPGGAARRGSITGNSALLPPMQMLIQLESADGIVSPTAAVHENGAHMNSSSSYPLRQSSSGLGGSGFVASSPHSIVRMRGGGGGGGMLEEDDPMQRVVGGGGLGGGSPHGSFSQAKRDSLRSPTQTASRRRSNAQNTSFSKNNPQCGGKKRKRNPLEVYPDGEAPKLDTDDRDWSSYVKVAQASGRNVCSRYFALVRYAPAVCWSLAVLNVCIVAAALALFLVDADHGMNHPYVIAVCILIGVSGLVGTAGLVAVPIALYGADENTANALQLTVSGSAASACVPVSLGSTVNLREQMTSYRLLYLTGMQQVDARIAWLADLWMRAVPFLDDDLVEQAVSGPPPIPCAAGAGDDGAPAAIGTTGDAPSGDTSLGQKSNLLSPTETHMLGQQQRATTGIPNGSPQLRVNGGDDVDESDLSSISESGDDEDPDNVEEGDPSLLLEVIAQQHRGSIGDDESGSSSRATSRFNSVGHLARQSTTNTISGSSSSNLDRMSSNASIASSNNNSSSNVAAVVAGAPPRITASGKPGGSRADSSSPNSSNAENSNDGGGGTLPMPTLLQTSASANPLFLGGRKPSLINCVNMAVKAFISRLPYANKTSPKTVVVVHFAFYFNRHGGQRPPPPQTAGDIIREFVSTAIHCVNGRSGSVHNVAPNTVTACWEVGATGTPSVMTCELNACAAAKEFVRMMKVFRQRALAEGKSPMTKSMVDVHSATAAPAASAFANGGAGCESMTAILQRSSFTVGIARGAVLRGTLGTSSKQNSVLFGPVVQKAAMLAEVGVKVHASVVLASSVYFANNMSFVMRPVEEIEVPKWLTEAKLGARFGAVGGGGGNTHSPRDAAHMSPFRGAMTPHPGDSFPSDGGAGAMAVEDIAGLRGRGGGGGAGGGSNSVALNPQTSGYEIETVYQLLSLGSADASSPAGGKASLIGQKDAEWMYELEKHGGAELHNMSVAFDAFRAGNLQLASSLYEALLVKSRQANYYDRFVTNKVRFLCDVAKQAYYGGGGGAAAAGRMSSLGTVGMSAANSNTAGGGGLLGIPGAKGVGSRPVSSMAEAQPYISNDSQVFNSSWDESSAGGEMLNRVAATGPINPRRLAIEQFFGELKQQGRRYARRVHTIGADDFSFE